MRLKSFLASAMVAFFACQVSAKTLRVGMETTFSPFEYYNTQNELVGFDVDIANRICELMEDKCNFLNLPFDGLIGALKMRKIDFAISGIDITAARQKQIDFTTPYYQNTEQYFIVNNDSADIPFATLQQKKIGVQNGTTQQRYFTTEYPKTEIASYAQITTALMDLKNHRIDAFFIDASVAKEIISNDSNFKILSDKITDSDYFGLGLGIAVRKDNSELLEQLNYVLSVMKEDGSYQKIYAKWFN